MKFKEKTTEKTISIKISELHIFQKAVADFYGIKSYNEKDNCKLYMAIVDKDINLNYLDRLNREVKNNNGLGIVLKLHQYDNHLTPAQCRDLMKTMKGVSNSPWFKLFKSLGTKKELFTLCDQLVSLINVAIANNTGIDIEY